MGHANLRRIELRAEFYATAGAWLSAIYFAPSRTNATTGYTEYTDAATRNKQVAALSGLGGCLRRRYFRARCAAIELNLSFIAFTRSAPSGAVAISFSRLDRNCAPKSERKSPMKSSIFAHTP
jgi:hypothetical protein